MPADTPIFGGIGVFSFSKRSESAPNRYEEAVLKRLETRAPAQPEKTSARARTKIRPMAAEAPVMATTTAAEAMRSAVRAESSK